MNEDEKRTVTAIKQSVYYRNYRRARDRAFVRLAQAHPDDYRILFEEERAKDEAEGKTWTSSGTVIIPPAGNRIRPRKKSLPGPAQANRNKQDEGYVGGEE